MTLNRFIVCYSLILFLIFQLHNLYLGIRCVNSNLIFKSYIFFYFFSLIFFILIYLKAKKKSQLSIIFFVGSAIKLVIFFLIFRPTLLQGSFIDKFGISVFLVPYSFSAGFVIYCLSRLLVKSK